MLEATYWIIRDCADELLAGVEYEKARPMSEQSKKIAKNLAKKPCRSKTDMLIF